MHHSSRWESTVPGGTGDHGLLPQGCSAHLSAHRHSAATQAATAPQLP